MTKMAEEETTRGKSDSPAPPPKANVWTAEYAGSGTFIFHKPKRKHRKRHQVLAHNRRPRMR